MAIPWPAIPSVIRRSFAMGVSRLTGRNSDATSAKAQTDMAKTPFPDAGCLVVSLWMGVSPFKASITAVVM
jgi:hypothetical protein